MRDWYVMEVYKDRGRSWRWRCRAPNGRLICCSGEAFTRKRDAFRASETCLQRLRDAAVIWREPVTS